MLKKTHCFLEKIKQKFSTTAGRDKFQFCPYECGPCNCKSNVPMFRKIDRKKVKTMCHSQKSNAYICSNAEFALFLPGSKNSLGLLWRPADSQLAPWLLWSWPPVWAPARWSPPRPPRWSPSILSFSVWWRLLVLRGKYKMTPWTWTMNNCCWS